MFSKLITSIFLLSLTYQTCLASEHITHSYIEEKLQTINSLHLLEIKQKLGTAKYKRPKFMKIAYKLDRKAMNYLSSNDWINPEDIKAEYLVNFFDQEAYKTKKTDFGARSFLYNLLGLTHFKSKQYGRAIASYDMVLQEEILEIFSLNQALVELAKIHYLLGDFELSQEFLYLGIYISMTKLRTRDKDKRIPYQKDLLDAIEKRANPKDFRTIELFLPGRGTLEDY